MTFTRWTVVVLDASISLVPCSMDVMSVEVTLSSMSRAAAAAAPPAL
jgi:hypothetical protein